MLAKPDVWIYTHVSNQHPDTLRFLNDVEKKLGVHVEVLQSERYSGVDDVIERNRYINGAGGAKCTLELKKRVRQEWEKQHFERHTYVWGYDIDERKRAERIIESMPEHDHEFPLIDRMLTKSDCHSIVADMGIARPKMYDLGYPNNNCIGCVKGGMGYWNKIRVDFPEVFERRAAQERLIGHSCIKGIFLDELEEGRGINNPVIPDCSLACEITREEV